MLRDKDFALIEDLLPGNGKRGGPWKCHRTMLNRIFGILYTGAHWRELPERSGKRSSVNERLNRWRADGTLDRIRERLHLKLDEDGRIDHALGCIDAMHMPASRWGAGEKGSR